MKLSTVALLLAAFTTTGLAQSQTPAPSATGVTPWTPTEAIRAAYASFGPRDPLWSPDSGRLTYLAPNEDLLSVDPATGKVTVLVDHSHLESVMNPKINEKDKDHRSRYHTAEYHFSPDSHRILFDAGGELWDYTLATGTGVKIGSTGAGSGDDPKFAPTAAAVSYLKDHNIYVRNLSGGPETNLTNTQDPAVLNGEVDWVYEEELDVPQQLFLVAGLEAHRLPADERDQGSALSDRRLDPDACHGRTCSAIRSPAIPIPTCASASSAPAAASTTLDQAADQARQRLHSALRLGQRPHRVG